MKRKDKKRIVCVRGQDKSPLGGLCSRSSCGERITQPPETAHIYTLHSLELRDKVRASNCFSTFLLPSIHIQGTSSAFSSLRLSGLAFMLCAAPFQTGRTSSPKCISYSRSFDGQRVSYELFSPDFGQCPKSISYFFPCPHSSFPPASLVSTTLDKIVAHFSFFSPALLSDPYSSLILLYLVG